MPAPQRIAPYAVALTADVVDPRDADDDLASGRFVLLHDPRAPEPWDGEWRAVTFARAELEPELASDPMLGAVGWSLAHRRPRRPAASATSPRPARSPASSRESFAGLADRAGERRDGGPRLVDPARPRDVGDHLLAWSDLLCTIAGLPPLPEGVVALPGPRR